MARGSPTRRIASAPDAPTARTVALRLLSRRELTAAELRQRLREREYPAAEIDAVIEGLVEDGTLDDRRAARSIARAHAVVKRRGPLRIARELASRGVDPDVARAALDDVLGEIPRTELLERALQRRLRSGRIQDDAHFRRLYQYLIRQGFEPGEVMAALKRYRP